MAGRRRFGRTRGIAQIPRTAVAADEPADPAARGAFCLPKTVILQALLRGSLSARSGRRCHDPELRWRCRRSSLKSALRRQHHPALPPSDRGSRRRARRRRTSGSVDSVEAAGTEPPELSSTTAPVARCRDGPTTPAQFEHLAESRQSSGRVIAAILSGQRVGRCDATRSRLRDGDGGESLRHPAYSENGEHRQDDSHCHDSFHVNSPISQQVHGCGLCVVSCCSLARFIEAGGRRGGSHAQCPDDSLGFGLCATGHPSEIANRLRARVAVIRRSGVKRALEGAHGVQSRLSWHVVKAAPAQTPDGPQR